MKQLNETDSTVPITLGSAPTLMVEIEIQKNYYTFFRLQYLNNLLSDLTFQGAKLTISKSLFQWCPYLWGQTPKKPKNVKSHRKSEFLAMLMLTSTKQM